MFIPSSVNPTFTLFRGKTKNKIMKEVKIKYHMDGKEVEKELIDWNRTVTIKLDGDKPNHAYVTYRDNKGHSTRFKEADKCPKGIQDTEAYKILENIVLEDTNKCFDEMFPLSEEELSKVLSYQEEKDTLKSSEDYDSIYERKKDYKYESLATAFPWLVDLSKYEDTVKTSHLKTNVGIKHNNHKAPLDIVQTRQFPKALQLIALATAFGHHKYSETDKHYTNFKNVEGGAQTYLDAAARHNTNRGETDKDSGLHHIIHSAWNNLAALELWIEEQGVDVENYSKTYLENLHNKK